MKKIIVPQRETTPDRQTSRSGCHLPATMVSDQVRRMAISAAVGGGLWTFGLVMDGIVRPNTVAVDAPAAVLWTEAAALLMSVLMLAFVRVSSHCSQTKADVGLLFFAANAAAVALLNNWARSPIIDVVRYVSWNAVVILVGAMIIPSSPRKMLVTALVAASMDPLAVWFAHLRGVQTPSLLNTFVLFLPNYACAVVAVVPSTAFQRVGRTLRHAQEMGSYHLIELLGRGGMGEVWRAEHRLLARSAAIKLVRPELLGASAADARQMLLRFQREAQATATLSSPHTIRLFDFGITEDRTFYYVMERLNGRDLESLVRQFGPLSPERVAFLLRQVVHSLTEAHAQGLVHRDVTPANIYACHMGLDYDFVKVLDFGLVAYNDRRPSGESMLTAAHVTTGTPAFMAPEVILENAVDARADIYALGCVAYFLLTGQLVFEAKTPMAMFVQHLQSMPPAPSTVTELPIPAELDALVIACLQKDPAKRPQSMDEVLSLLDRYRPSYPWTNASARGWWDHHLVDVATVAPESSSRTTMAAVDTLAVA
jgi:tRNA A-37 threonylcarbamoyl transferase component Bud32